MKNIVIIKFLVVERYLESILELYLQFNKEYLIILLELMVIYMVLCK
jgi:hypothetical protein